MVSDSNASAIESVKTKNNDSSSSQFAQIMDSLRPQNGNRTSSVSDRRNSGRAINNGSRKSFETTQFETAQKESLIRSKKEIYTSDRPKNNGTINNNTEIRLSDADTKEAKVNKESASDKDKEITAEKNIENIAAVLGLSSAELKIILNAAGINMTDLSDSANASQISEKLAAFLGLDNQMKQELQQIIAAITEQGTDINEFQNILGMSVEDVKKGLNIQGSLEVERVSEKATAKLTRVFRQKLSEISQSSEEAQKEAEVDLNEGALIEKAESGFSENNLKELQKGNAAKSSENYTNDENDSAQEEGIQLFNNAEVDNVELIQSNTLSERDEQSFTITGSKDDMNDMNIQPNSVFYNSSPEKEVNETIKPVTGNIRMENEVVKQVVEKAKVILDGDKSEMVLSLKPESLGKLSLMIVTENGIVTAKFVAENQQVKQILESNMQLLKENLESQGLNVQSFSVSVRQDSGNEKGYYSEQNNGRRNQNVKPQNISATMTTPSGFIHTENGSTYLNWGESTINLMA